MDSENPPGNTPEQKPFIQPPPGMQPPPAKQAARQPAQSEPAKRPVPQRPPPKPAPSGPAPAFKEHFESAVSALFSPGATFTKLALRPAPAFAESGLAGMVWAVGASALGILIIQMRLPADAGLGVVTMILSFVAVVTASAFGIVLVSGLLHGISIVSGGSGGFDRSLQTVAHLAPLLSVLAVILWFSNPLLLILPTLWGTWLTVHAIGNLHDADLGQAWMVAGALGLAAAGSQIIWRADVAVAYFGIEDRITIYAVDPNAARRYSNESAKTLRAPMRTGRTAAPAMPENPMNVGGSGNGNAGSFGMIRQPGTQTNLAGDPNLQMPHMPAQIPSDPVEMQKMGMGMLGDIKSQMDANPDLIEQLPPDQRDLVKKYLDIAERASKGDISAVKDLDPEDIKADSRNLMKYANEQGTPRKRR